jgi:hypothetical protein
VLLIDTYDTEAAAAKVVALAPRLKALGIAIHAVRIDSGDLIALSAAFWTRADCKKRASLQAAELTRIGSAYLHTKRRRSTALASARPSRLLQTPPHSIVPTNYRNTPACRAASASQARQPGPAVSRSGDVMIEMTA